MHSLYYAMFRVHGNGRVIYRDNFIKKLKENDHEIVQRNYRKMTMKWSFPYNSFVKFNS